MSETRVLYAFGEPLATGGQESFVCNVLQVDDTVWDGFSFSFYTPYSVTNEVFYKLAERYRGTVTASNLDFCPGGLRTSIVKPFRDFLKTHSFDVVHIHSGSISVLGLMAREAKRAGVGHIIVHSHATGAAKTMKYRCIKMLMDPVLASSATDYLACSDAAGKWKFPKSAFEGNHYVVVKNGIQTERHAFDPVIRREMRHALGYSESDVVLGTVGRMVPEKNHAFLLDVLECVRANGIQAKLLLVGDGELRKATEGRIHDGGLSEYAQITGLVQGVERYLQAMDLFLLPSLYEGLGIAAIEAQANGLHVIASDTVPHEANLTGNVDFLPLSTGPQAWAQRVCEVDPRHRDLRGHTVVKDCGYDSTQTALQLRSVYTRDL